MQLEKMREYIENRNWKLTVEFEEVGSGAKTRPKREELVKMARRREIDAILVWKLDRFGRSMADLVMTLNELREIGVVLYLSPNRSTSLLRPGERWRECFRRLPNSSAILSASASKPVLPMHGKRANRTADRTEEKR